MIVARAESPLRMLHLDIHRHHKPLSHGGVVPEPCVDSCGKVKVPSEIVTETQNSTDKKLETLAANKRGSSGMIQFPPEKRKKQIQEMNRSVSVQCSFLLKSLMGHSKGWPFIEPVFYIPKYLSMISKPMDLGTIKSNLEMSLYADIDAFAADIRLTFSNAIRYNPPHNYVHKLAVEMSELFEKRWKSLEEKWKFQFRSEVLSCKQSNENSAVKQNDPDSSLVGAAVPKRAKISEKTVGTTSSFNPKTASKMIRRRFADTILKAQEEKHLLTGEAASRREVYLKRQQQEEREAARVALEKIENHANLEENLDGTAELENLCGLSLAYNVSFCHEWSCDEPRGKTPTWRPYHGSPVELLGLFLKKDYAIDREEDGEIENEDTEGEI